MRRALPTLALAVLTFLARADALVTNIKVQGGHVGTNRYESSADGSFTSTTEMKVGTITIASSLSGKVQHGALSRFEFSLSQGPVNVKATYGEGKLTAEQGGKVVANAVPLDLAGMPCFSAIHPQVLGSFFRYHESRPSMSKVRGFSIDNLAVLEFEIVSSADRKVVSSTGAVVASDLRLKIAGLNLEIVGNKETTFGISIPAQSTVFELEGTKGVFEDPLAKFPELSQPRYKTKRTTGLEATMRDGTKLKADVVMPEQPGKWPVILVRTCYGRGLSLLQAEFFASRGYAFVAQDVRGRGDSEGDFDPLVQETADGYDTLEWIAKQEWSSGRVGMIGGSYLGFVQWCAASTHHRTLKCIVPQVSPPDPTRNFPWDHGMFMLAGTLWWARIGGDRSGDVANALAELKGMKKLETLPLTKADDAFLGKDVPWFDRWLARDSLAKWAGAFTLADVAKVKIPVLHISGTWDGDGIGTKLHWETMRAAGKKNQWLVFGPWSHAFNTSSAMGDVQYGADAILELDSLYLRFFDTNLKQREGYMDKVPKVRFFLSGANRWLDLPDWPPPGSWAKTWYLTGGSSRGFEGGGRLSATQASVGPATMVYDPTAIKVEKDSMTVEMNPSLVLPKEALAAKDTLIFRTEPFQRATKIGGPVGLEMFVSTSGRDAGLLVSIAEQRADGSVRSVCLPGKARIGWNDRGTWGPVPPGKVIHLTVEPWEFAHEFPKGSRLLAIVTCNGFPGLARIPGTGESEATATKLVKTTQTLYRSGNRASRLTVTMLPG
ncbi:MAG: CocE/NonD family hydrolase [Fimbriimonadaceae bacterium]|nr:CocE/NonD family hydrolase [Fimbriimonadaceae bacterium]